jgi:hypothetical protein
MVIGANGSSLGGKLTFSSFLQPPHPPDTMKNNKNVRINIK